MTKKSKLEMKRFRFSFLLHFILVGIILFIPIFSIRAMRTTDNEDFDLTVIGTLSNIRYFGPPPIPPNYTTVSSITWDFSGNYGLIFRLNYYGSSPVEIIQLLFWQEATEFGITWNVTSPIQISPPEYTMVKHSCYEFSVEGLFIAETIVFAKITLENRQEVLISVQIPWYNTYFPSWPSSSMLGFGNPIEYLVFFAVSSCVLLLYRQGKIGK